MDDSPHINKWSDSPPTSSSDDKLKIRSHYIKSHAFNSVNNKDKDEHKEHEDKEMSRLHAISINDENTDGNIMPVPFHLSRHHLADHHEQNKKIKKNHDRHDDIDPAPTVSSISSMNPSPNRFDRHHRPMMRSTNFRSSNPSYSHHQNQQASARSNRESDKLQRRVQKLEQDILSKNIQHDIMVNKEEMMAKRLKTKDIRIKNLQNDINKLREQLTVKNETQESLMNEMTEIQEQNRGLSTKLRESGHGLGSTLTMDSKQNEDAMDSDTHHYKESMRDMLNNLQQAMHDLSVDVEHIKQHGVVDHNNHQDNTEETIVCFVLFFIFGHLAHLVPLRLVLLSKKFLK